VKRISATLTIASAVVGILSLILLPVSQSLRLPDYASHSDAIDPNASFSIGSFHCAISRGRIWYFNDELPYVGSILGMDGTWGGKRTTERTDWAWGTNRYAVEQASFIDDKGQSAGRARYGDVPGIYYRHFEWSNDPRPWWTLAASLWYPVALSAMLPSWWLIRKLRDRRQSAAHA
jgi:hypothetical protein